MNYLNVKALPESTKRAKVLWATGASKKGALIVESPYEVDDIDVLSELTAIRYLLMERQILGNPVKSGKGISITVTKGAIKKLIKGKSQKRYLQKFAAFFKTRLIGVELKVDKNSTFLPPDDIEPTDTICPDARTYEVVETPKLGRVLVTDHALMRYMERSFDGKPENAYKSLANRLIQEDLVEIKLPPRVTKHKSRKYGTNQSTSIWRHRSDSLHFALVKEGESNVLVT